MTWNQTAQRWLSDEQGTIRKDWGGRVPIALIYPNTYYIGMSSLGFQTIYNMLNGYDDVVCERFFWEEPLKKPTSIESGRRLDDFSVLAFSISNELDYFNVATMLKSSAIPLFANERDEGHPIVLAGGPCVTANPEPLSPFFDCFAIGDGEAIVSAFIALIAEEAHTDRCEMLEALASTPGIYVPIYRDIYEERPVSRQWVRNIDEFATASAILTPHTEFSNMYIIEITRGCRWGCRFCLTGFASRPPRFRSLAKLVSQARQGLKLGRRIGLLGSSVSDHPDIDELVTQLRHMGAEISTSSLRIRPLSRILLQGITDSGTTTVTLAPEAGSERLRQLINKGVCERDIVTAVDQVGELGFRQLKLYFMIGLPTETAEDIGELIRLVLDLKARLDLHRTGIHVILSVEPFVPKAGTPFQWLPMGEAKLLSHRLSRIKSTLEPKGVEVRSDSVHWAVVQGVLSRGDSRLANVLANMEQKSLSAWRRALAESSVDTQRYIAREIPLNERLPWDILELGIDKDFLKKELELAFKGGESPPCPLIECHKCGVC